ncbi:Macrolide export ATP-binding/permease protein MacB [Methanosarcinaceae archaeon Ag5]|uniref:Macrolide export ATP-binding/permease protein MacB n=1 Tax=Methanolapillus africanus TaxID=3028297 RepID=A0AAE4SEG9_9EURY|nr:Macrolide export ATP-binding/permease protein MacB [Methanosarcinaceae archaeon Ag5]
MISIAHSSKMAVESLRSSKMRSALTALGIIIGIAAVVATFTFGSSFGAYMESQISSEGSNYISISATQENIFFDQQVDIVADTPGVASATPHLSKSGTLEYMGESRNYTISGTKEEYAEAADLPMYEGNFFTDKDVYTAVIGKSIAKDAFKNEISSRSTIELTVFNEQTREYVTKKFKVSGIVGEDDTSLVGRTSSSNVIIIPAETLKNMSGKDDYQMIFAVTESEDNVSEVADEVEERLARSVGVSDRELRNTSEYDSAGGFGGGGKIPFIIFNQADMLEQVGSITNTLELFLIGIGGISLVVGSIGIMNIMLVTVTERTKEIGTLKALGYSARDVLSLFIVESVIISVLGGAAGVALGLSVAYVGSGYLGIPPVIPMSTVVAGIGVSAVIGVFAGVYPANKAARMDPVEALRKD